MGKFRKFWEACKAGKLLSYLADEPDSKGTSNEIPLFRHNYIHDMYKPQGYTIKENYDDGKFLDVKLVLYRSDPPLNIGQLIGLQNNRPDNEYKICEQLIYTHYGIIEIRDIQTTGVIGGQFGSYSINVVSAKVKYVPKAEVNNWFSR